MSAAEGAPPDDRASPDDGGRVDDAALARLARRLGDALRARGLRIALAESCTGGWIAKLLTDVPGASDWFEQGYVTYSNRAKTADLGVPEALLAAEGAVSEAAVRAMVKGLRRQAGAGIAMPAAAIAVSGIAGPGGGSRDKPVGTVHFGFALGEREWAAVRHFGGDRDAVRRRSVAFALEQMSVALASEAHE